jgi:hypothetical protein
VTRELLVTRVRQVLRVLLEKKVHMDQLAIKAIEETRDQLVTRELLVTRVRLVTRAHVELKEKKESVVIKAIKVTKGIKD